MLKNFLNKDFIEAGCDEAGRGCLAGPVVAAAVILPPNFRLKELDDSKKLNEKTRNKLRPIIEEKALAYAVAFIEPEKIDEINILNASFLAMTNAVKALTITPDQLLIDGNRFRTDLEIPYHCIIKGDGKFKSIAAASILAKTYRDEYMLKIHQEHPEYGWNQNMGYPTVKHRKAIEEFGICDHHRKTFNHSPKQLTIDF